MEVTTARKAPDPERADAAGIAARMGVPVVDIVVPVHNEQDDLAPSVRRLHTYLSRSFPYRFRITIADNASTDETHEIAEELARELPDVVLYGMPRKGRGRALHAVWSASDCPVLAYMDVDLSTELPAIAPLLAPLVSGHSDLAIGSRLVRGARVVRGPKREVISRCYNLLLRGTLAAHFSDAQCGFKAIRSDVARQLLPLVTDTGWFFDTELLVLAERSGMRIHEVAVDWVDDPDSRVDIVAAALADLKGILRLGRERVARHQFEGLLVFGLGLAVTSGSLAALHAMTTPGRLAEIGALVAANLVATVLRFLLLRGWVFDPRRTGEQPDHTE